MIGKKIEKIFMDEQNLQFQMSDGELYSFTVYGDCCSTSAFYDFIGVQKILGNTVVDIQPVDLDVDDEDEKQYDSEIKVYGYQVTSEHPEFGEVTGVFSFRNYSNGYYGGSIENSDLKEVVAPEVLNDVIET